MVENIQQLFATSLADFGFLAVILIAMVPICESRVAIPFGMASEIWGQNALSPITSFFASFIGGCLITAIILLLLKPIVNKLKSSKRYKNFATSLENKFKSKSDEVLEDNTSIKHKKWNAWLSVMLFVATPAPMTGVWTGSAIACFTNLTFFKSFLAVTVGNIIGNIIILLLCTLLKDYIFILLIASISLTVIAILGYMLSKHKKQKINEKTGL